MPRIMGTSTSKKRIKRRMKTVELKCELLKRAKILKQGKKSGISEELAIKSCTFIIAGLGITTAG